MENEQLKALYDLKTRLLTLEKLAQSYKGSPKAIKLCIKLINIEAKSLDKCTAVNTVELREIQHTYAVLCEALYGILKKSAKSENDLQALIEKTETQVSDLYEQLNPLSENVRKFASSVDGTAQKLSAKLENGAHMLGNAINEKVEEIRKKFKNEE